MVYYVTLDFHIFQIKLENVRFVFTEVNYTLNLDTRALNKRIEFRTIANSTQSGYGTLNYNMTIETGTPACETYDVYVKVFLRH